MMRDSIREMPNPCWCLEFIDQSDETCGRGRQFETFARRSDFLRRREEVSTNPLMAEIRAGRFTSDVECEDNENIIQLDS